MGSLYDRIGTSTTKGGNMLSAIKINAGNDTNGNPRRGWVILNTAEGYTAVVDFCDEGYDGSAAVTNEGYPRSLAEAPEFLVPVTEYRQMLRLHETAKHQ
jgi:hypothetical protein